jgi:AAA+ ATPase superfamily predicted ATPase
MKFINREKEMEKLNELWQKDNSQRVVVHGKRRVEKQS